MLALPQVPLFLRGLPPLLWLLQVLGHVLQRLHRGLQGTLLMRHISMLRPMLRLLCTAVVESLFLAGTSILCLLLAVVLVVAVQAIFAVLCMLPVLMMAMSAMLCMLPMAPVPGMPLAAHAPPPIRNLRRGVGGWEGASPRSRQSCCSCCPTPPPPPPPPHTHTGTQPTSPPHA